MTGALRSASYRLFRRSNLWLWAAFCIYASFGFRAAVLPDTSYVGLIDDATLAFGALGFFAALDGFVRPLRLITMAVFGLLLAAFNMFNAFFFLFFDSLLNLDAWQLLGQASGASTSIKALVTPRMVALHVAIPVLLILAGVFSSGFRRPKLRTPLIALGWAMALLLGAARGAVASEEFVLAENNGLMHVARQWVEREYLLHGANSARMNTKIVDTLAQTYNLPPPERYRSGTDERYPLLRIPVASRAPPAKPLNVVILMLESFRLREAGIGRSDGAKVAGNLDALAKDSLMFTDFYANGHQTVRGEQATLCSMLPNYSGGQVYSQFEDIGAACLPEVLRDHGYETHWISGFSAKYCNKRGFLSRHGVDFFHDDEELTRRPLMKPKLGWGPSDEDIADYAVDILDKARRPFFAEVMTLSSHHPFNYNYGIPDPAAATSSRERTVYRDYLRAMHYVDYAVGRFMEKARSRPWFTDTVFVILGDHGVWLFPEKGAHSLTPAERIETYYRMPLLIYSPAHVTPAVRDIVASQVDVAPTLLDIVGIDAPQSFEGASLLQDVPADRRFAIMGNENGWSIRQGNVYCYAVGYSCFTDMQPLCPKGFERKPVSHACFRTDGDLLDESGDAALQTLEARESADVLARGRRLVNNNVFLLMHDAYFPREHKPARRAEVPPTQKAMKED